MKRSSRHVQVPTFSRELVLSLLLSSRLFPESVETREPLESACCTELMLGVELWGEATGTRGRQNIYISGMSEDGISSTVYKLTSRRVGTFAANPPHTLHYKQTHRFKHTYVFLSFSGHFKSLYSNLRPLVGHIVSLCSHIVSLCSPFISRCSHIVFRCSHIVSLCSHFISRCSHIASLCRHIVSRSHCISL